MRQSRLFGATTRDVPRDEVSINAQLLLRAGFIAKLMSGVYSVLPLGWRVVNAITAIIREEMNAMGAQEVFLPALQPKELWMKTNRWDAIDVMYRFEDSGKRWLALGPTHEEVITDLAGRYLTSYKDLPLALYQIQTKFRDEPRAKSGILRGREFIMKDLYSFHNTTEDLEHYYDTMIETYHRVFKRCGIPALLVEASGGVFSKYSHEFMVETPAGEDLVFTCSNCQWAQNREIATIKEGDSCPRCSSTDGISVKKTVEVGNIFKLGTRFSEPLQAHVRDHAGNVQSVIMGCYGIGVTRILGTVVEVNHDEQGITWPEAIAPYQVHLICLAGADASTILRADALYEELQKRNVSVLYDDRPDRSAGARFADADLLGLPYRAIVSTRNPDTIEIKHRRSGATEVLPTEAALNRLQSP